MNAPSNPQEQPLFENKGFRIVQIGSLIRFEHRNTQGVGIVAMILAGMTLILAVNTVVLGLVLEASVSSRVMTSLTLLAVTALCAFLTRLTYKSWRAQKAVSGAESALLTLDRSNGNILGPDGTQIGHASQAQIRRKFDPFDSTQGLMRYLEVQTSRGWTRIYKSGSGTELEQIESWWMPPS